MSILNKIREKLGKQAVVTFSGDPRPVISQKEIDEFAMNETIKKIIMDSAAMELEKQRNMLLKDSGFMRDGSYSWHVLKKNKYLAMSNVLLSVMRWYGNESQVTKEQVEYYCRYVMVNDQMVRLPSNSLSPKDMGEAVISMVGMISESSQSNGPYSVDLLLRGMHAQRLSTDPQYAQAMLSEQYRYIFSKSQKVKDADDLRWRAASGVKSDILERLRDVGNGKERWLDLARDMGKMIEGYDLVAEVVNSYKNAIVVIE